MYFKITNLKKYLPLVILLLAGTMSAQTSVSRVITDWNGYWSSIAISGTASQQPDDHHNLVGFQVGTTIYSTGVNDNLLTTNGISYSPGNFKALPISGITGSTGASAFIVLGKNIDGNPNAANYLSPAVDNLTLLDVMIDGTNGLDLGTGSTNISTGAVLNFSISNVDQTKINDAEPDIVITQIADPSSGTNDTFSFRDINGNIVGNAVVVAFNNITAVGTYRMDLFTLATGQPYATVTPSGNGAAGAGTRDIRIVSLRLADFGITSDNSSSIASLRFAPGGASDPAFIAYNANAFLIPAPEITQQPVSQVACPGLGNSATFTVTATGTGLTYQWRKNGVNISGATGDSYTISNVQASDVGSYSVIVTNAAGSVASSTVYLNTVAALQPVTTTTCINTPANISFEANGLNATYQWYSNTSLSNTGGTLIPGATSETYSPPVNVAGTYYYYSVATSDNQGCTSLASNAVAFTVNAASVAGTAASNHTVCTGNTTQVTLSGHTGSIQWQQSANGTSGWVNVTGGSGATTATYTTPALNATTYYRANVTSGTCSTATSNTVTVTVTGTNIWTGNVSTAWNTAGNWECNIVPTLLLNAEIPAGRPNYPVIDGADGIADCKDIIVADGATVTVNGDGEGILRIAGIINNTGVMNAVDGTIAMLGTSAQVIPADTFETNTLRNLTINNASGVTLGGATDLTGILALTAGQFTTGNALTLKSNAATTAMIAPVTGSITGTMIIERYIPARRAFRFISSPVNGGSINANWQEGASAMAGWGTDITGAGAPSNGFDESGSNNPSMFTYNNIARTWNAVSNTLTTNLSAGTPYRLLVRGDRTIDQFQNESEPTNTTLRSTGNVVTGNVVANNFSEDAGDLNFVGNPYQAPVNMIEVLADASNLNPTFYTVWDPTLGGAPVVGVAGGRGAYVTIDLLEGDNSNPASDANEYLQPNQAAFVQTLSGGPASLTFKEEYKDLLTNTTPLLYRNANDQSSTKIKLQLFDSNSMALNETSADGFVIRFSDEYSDEVDTGDAIKMTNQDENVAVLNGTRKLSIERRSMPQVNEVVQLFNSQYRKTNYTYSVSVEALDNVTAYLLDNYTQGLTELTNNSQTVYNFTVNPDDEFSIDANRFAIVFAENALGENDFASVGGVSIYPNPASGDEFYVRLSSGAIDTVVTVFNAMGQKVHSSVAKQAENTLLVKAGTQLAAGVYIVQIEKEGRAITKKLIIK